MVPMEAENASLENVPSKLHDELGRDADLKVGGTLNKAKHERRGTYYER